MARLAQLPFLPALRVARQVGFAGTRIGGAGGVSSAATPFSGGGVSSAATVFSAGGVSYPAGGVSYSIRGVSYFAVGTYSSVDVYSAVSTSAAFIYPHTTAVELIGYPAMVAVRERFELPASIYQSFAGETVPSTQGRRSRELVWRKAHTDYLREVFLGQWIVLEGDQIIASSPDPAEVVKTARRRGIRSPYVFRVEGRPRPRTSSLGL